MTIRRLFRPLEWPMLTKLLVTFGLIALLPLAATGWYGYTVARQTVLETQERALIKHAESLAGQLDVLLAERREAIRLLAADPSVRTYSSDWSEATPEIQMAAREHLDNLARANPYFQAVYLMNRQGEVILSTADNLGLNFDFRPYFQQALAGDAYISDISVSVDLGQPVIYFSAPVYGGEGKVAAVAVLRVLAEEIWARVEAEKDALGPGSVAILFDEYGLRLAHASDRGLIFKAVVPLDPQVEAQLLAENRLGTAESILATDYPELAAGLRQVESQPYFTHRLAIRDELFHAGAARMNEKPWIVIESVPESTFLAPINYLLLATRLAAGMVALLALLVSLLAARQIVRPLRELTAASRRLASGELEQPLRPAPFRTRDEIWKLQQSFESMRVRLKDSYADLQLLQQVTMTANASSDFAAALQICLDLVCERTSWPVGHVYLTDEGNADKLISTSIWHLDQPERFETFRQVTEVTDFQRGVGLPGRVLASGEPAWIIDVTSDPNFPRAHLAQDIGVRAGFAFPVFIGSAVVAVLEFFSESAVEPDEGLLKIMTHVGVQLGRVAERQQALMTSRQQASRLVTIGDVVRLAASLDLAELLWRVVELVQQAFSYSYVNLLLVDPPAGELVLRASAGSSGQAFPENLRLKIGGQGITCWVAANGQPLLVNDVAADERYYHVEGTVVGAELAVPIMWEERVIGVLDAQSADTGTLDHNDLFTLQTLAGHLAVKIEQARLYTQAQERLERISALHDIDVAIVSQLSLEETLDVLLEKVTERLGMDAAAIALINPLTSELEYAARRGLDGDFFIDGLLKVADGVAGQVAHTGQPAFISDVREDERFVRRAIARQLGIVSYMAVPLQARGEVIGVLELAATQQHAYLPEEVDFFETLAGQAAIVLDNARMYDQALRRAAQARALAESAGGVLATLDVDALWPEVTRAARQALAVNRAAIYLYDPANDQLSCPYAEGLSHEYVSELNRRFRQAPGGKLVSEPQTIIIADAQSDPATEGIRDLVAREGFHSYAIFPLPAPGLPLGAFVVYRDEITPFSPDDVSTGQTLAHIISVALQNTRLFEETQQRLKELTMLFGVSQSLSNAPLKSKEIASIVARQFVEVFGIPECSVSLLDPKENSLKILVDYYVEEDRPHIDQQWVGKVEPLSEYPATARVMETLRPLVVQASDPDADRNELAYMHEIGTGTLLILPLAVKGQAIGVIELETWQEEHHFSPEELNLAMTMANQMAVTLENARLFETERAARQQAETLRAATQALSATLDLQQVFELILTELQQVVAYDSASVQQLKGERLEVIGGRGFPNLEELLGVNFDVAAGDNPNGEVIRTRAPLILEDAPEIYEEFRREPHAAVGIRSWLGVPLLFGDRLIGMIALDKQEPGFYTGEHASLVAAFAAQAAVAIENARLYQQASQRLSELEFLHRVTLAVAATLDLDAALEQAVTMLADELGYQHVGIALVDKAGQSVDLRAEHGIPMSDWGPAGQGVRVGQGLVGWVAQHGEPLLVNDVTRDPRYLVGIPETRSELVVPLRADGRVTGVINVESLQLDAFDAEDLRLLNTLAGQLANSIERARLFEATRRQLQELAVLHVVASAATEAIGEDALIERATQVIGVAFFPDNFGLLLVDAAQGVLRIHPSYRGIRDEDKQIAIPLGEGITGRVAASGQSRRVADASREPAYLKVSGGMRSELCVPLMAGEHILGVINAESARPDAFGEADEQLLVTLAGQLATGIERARLFDETHRRAEELEALAAVSAALRQAQTREAMLPLLVETTMQLLNADSGALLLVEGETLTFAAAHGPAEAMLGLQHPLGDDPLWQVARTGEPMFIPDVTEQSEFTRWEVCRALMAGLRACACVPLKTAESTVGLLHLACQSPREVTEGEIRLLTSIAEMAGNALHRTALHEQTLQDAIELARAYDTTLEGWARALELRDQETEGHTRRVTEMTLRLARAMGIGEAELVHLRRGALLHDMGKMGIPDGILLKPGPLTGEEWAIMRMHPQYAYDMLSPIAYLRPALDIPYCHHEKWDGTGYPRGLKDEQIPLVARVFAVVDVWDALNSDRPYRKAWQEDKVREYVRQQAGKHFDPQVVEMFLELLKTLDEAALT